MNEKNFASLVVDVKEMAAHTHGDDVPGLKVATVPDSDVHAIREGADVIQKELAALLGVSRRTSRELGATPHPSNGAGTGTAANFSA
jgi:putative transcriptional regulator